MKTRYSKILLALATTVAVMGLVGCGKMKIKETNESEISDEAGLAQAMQFQEFGGERKLSLRMVQVSGQAGNTYENASTLKVTGELKVDSHIVQLQTGVLPSDFFSPSYPDLIVDARCLANQSVEPCAKLALVIVSYNSEATQVFQTGVVLTRVTDITKADPQTVMYRVKAHKELNYLNTMGTDDLAAQLFNM